MLTILKLLNQVHQHFQKKILIQEIFIKQKTNKKLGRFEDIL